MDMTTPTKRPYKKKKTSTNSFSVPKEITSLKRKVNRLEKDVEWKYSDVVDNGAIRATTSATQGELTHLNPTSQYSAAIFGRIGQRVTAKRLDLGITILSGNTAVTDYPQLFRCILLWDKQPNGAFPFLYNNGVGSDPQSILDSRSIQRITYAPMNHGSRKRFKVLWEKKFLVFPYSTQANLSGARHFSKSFDLKNRIVEYQDSSSGTITDLTSNSLIFVITNDSGADNATYELCTRFWYTDS